MIYLLFFLTALAAFLCGLSTGIQYDKYSSRAWQDYAKRLERQIAAYREIAQSLRNIR